MRHNSRIELSASALQRNLRYLRRVIGRGCRLSSVVKGNAYGHGIETFVPLAERCGADHFSVFSATEAERVLHCRTGDSEIMIMGMVEDEELGWAIEHDISFYVFDLQRLEAAVRHARLVGRKARVHLELETGMNRTGLQDDELLRAVAIIEEHPHEIEIAGVCTHYAGAESVSNYLRVQNQIESFHRQWAQLQQRPLAFGRRHTACSAAALTYPETIMDMVRFGIAQYGFWPSRETRMHYLLTSGQDPDRPVRRDPLRRVLSWKSQIMSVKQVKPGQFIGYGTTCQSTRTQRIAAVPVGYYHGFSRSLSNVGHVLVDGRRAFVAGIVNMNSLLVDVTDIPQAVRGAEVVLIGSQKKASMTVASFSDLSRFLNYEVLVRLPADIPRVVVD